MFVGSRKKLIEKLGLEPRSFEKHQIQAGWRNIRRIERFNKRLGALVKSMRTDAKMRQEDVANLLNMDRSLLSHYERGAVSMTMWHFMMLCTVTGFDPVGAHRYLIQSLKSEHPVEVNPQRRGRRFQGRRQAYL